MSDTATGRAARNHAAWIGPLVAIGGLLSYFLVAARFPSLRDSAWLNLALVAVGVAVAIYGTRRAFSGPPGVLRRALATIGLLFAVLPAALLGLYVFVISELVPEPTAVALGLDTLPEVTLTDADGRPFEIGPARGRRILLVFYRGHW